MLTTQRDNNVGGDLVGGDKNVYSPVHIVSHAQAAPLNALYAKLRENLPADANVLRIAEELQHYSSTSTDGDVRGLEDKLTSANRQSMLARAERLKQNATKMIMRLQTSPVAQAIVTMVLSKMYTDFCLYVTPAIEANAPIAEVDRITGECVVNPAVAMLGDNDLYITAADLMGLLYFLGGNCHIRWDKC